MKYWDHLKKIQKNVSMSKFKTKILKHYLTDTPQISFNISRACPTGLVKLGCLRIKMNKNTGSIFFF
jgi:hypothetical protein